MSVQDVIGRRALQQVVHFTTHSGALGALATGALLPRSMLADEKQIEFILKHNCDTRKDPEWAGHNSLSVTRVNSRFFSYSQYLHSVDPELWWCILAFEPAVLTHEGVVFCTGNNTWPKCARARGEGGIEALFAPSVFGRYETTHRRSAGVPDYEPTCPEAEVLYPGRLSLSHLARVYFAEQDHADVFMSQAAALAVELSADVAQVDPSLFRKP